MLLFTTAALFVVWSSLEVSGSLPPLLPGKNTFDGYNMAPWPKADVPMQPINYMRTGNDYLANYTATLYGMPGVDKDGTSEDKKKAYSLELRMDGLTRCEHCDEKGHVKGTMKYIQDGMTKAVKYEAGPAEEMFASSGPVNQLDNNMIRSSSVDINDQFPMRMVGGMPSSFPAAANPQTNFPDQSRPTGLNIFMQPNEPNAQPSMMPNNQQMNQDIRQYQNFDLGQNTQSPVNIPNLNQINPDLNLGGDFGQLRNEQILQRVSALMGQPAFDSAVNTNQNRIWRSDTQVLPFADATNSQYQSPAAQSIAALKMISELHNLQQLRSSNSPPVLVFLNKMSDGSTNDKERTGLVSDANEKEATKETTDFKTNDIMEALAKTIMTKMTENQGPEVLEKDISTTQST